MALSTDKKLYAAIGVLALLGGALYVQKQEQKKEAESYSLDGRESELPKIKVSDDDVKKIDKIVINKPAEKGEDGKETAKAVSFELQKQGEDWKLVKPVEDEANKTNVESLLNNLKTIKVTELINGSKDGYKDYQLTEAEALHVTFYKGKDAAYEFHFGESGSRGQMARIGNKEGVYAVKGYSSYLYNREAKGWRDTNIFKFEDTKAKHVTITNEHGSFEFDKEGDGWKGKFKKAKTGAARNIKDFDESKVKDMLRAFKSLNAADFGDDKSLEDAGLAEPLATVSITLDDGAKRELFVGANSEGSSRWAKLPSDEQVYSISSWSADWALAEPKKFQKADEEASKDDADHKDPHAVAAAED